MAKINLNIRTALKNVYRTLINDTILNMFEQNSPELVRMLNAYKGSFATHPMGNSADFNSATQLIRISTTYSINQFYLALAHELGHATGTNQSKRLSATEIQNRTPTTYTNGIAYSDSRTRGEGEAIYHEFLVAKELNLLLDFTKSKGNGVLKILNDQNITLSAKFNQLGKLNQTMIPSGQGNVVNKYTYDEKILHGF